MGGISGQGTNYNLPNFVGDIFQITPSDTPFLSSIGRLTGGERANATLFQWQAYDLRTASQNTRVEGAAAPTAEARIRTNISNVVQIHQEAIDIAYSKIAAVGQYSGLNIAGSNPVADEVAFQVEAMLKQIARDIEVSFISGSYQLPVDNTTPRKTRGILEAIATNVVNASSATLTEKMVHDLLKSVYDNGGIMEQDSAVIMVNSTQLLWLNKIFIKDNNYRETDRNIGGVAVKVIYTPFGTLNVMLNRHMPAAQIAVVSLEQCAPVFLEVPGKGFLFVEPLAKTGASERSQIYGEVGLKYGNEKSHGKIINLSTVAPGS